MMALAPIVNLLKACRPPAVARFVVSVVVDAINLKTRWAFSHVFQKRCERETPPLANPNAATAVVFEGFIGRVVAAANHIHPAIVGAASFAATIVSVSQLRLPPQDAAAGLDKTASELSACDGFGLTTVAATQPRNAAWGRANAADSGESSKALRCEINKLGHASLIRMFDQVAARMLKHPPAAILA